MKAEIYDILIIGAGPVGLSFAAGAAQKGFKVAVLEKQALKSIKTPSYDGREIALTHLSRQIMQEQKLWEHIAKEDVSLIKNAKVLNGDSPYTLHFDNRETGKENLGFMISNHKIRHSAYCAAKAEKNVKILHRIHVADIEIGQSHGQITLEDEKTGKTTKILQAPLIVAADSRFSFARKKIGIEASMLDFKRTCIVTKMKIEKSHDDTAFECFHYDRTLAVLPLNDKHVSVVITLDTEQKDDVLDMDKKAFGMDMTERTEGRYGQMSLSEELYSYPLVSVYARQFYSHRFALLGDAAVGMHPVTAHGFNLGLRGQATLLNILEKTRETGGDIGSLTALRQYHQKHNLHTKPMYHGTNALVKLYTRNSLPAKITRKALLHLGNHIRPARKIIVEQLTEERAKEKHTGKKTAP